MRLDPLESKFAEDAVGAPPNTKDETPVSSTLKLASISGTEAN